ncbi:hypothetical protein AKJ09_05294 [Labilithrix luteola]|uniref:Cytochrome c domain-containing protein n=1 Tax=Labilithrix luteola TaxID=1391654 RepID=A0A0K1PYM1_9BACT|nr:hypothetical protein AKJ09_05294 [Labilithrix luteola]
MSRHSALCAVGGLAFLGLVAIGGCVNDAPSGGAGGDTPTPSDGTPPTSASPDGAVPDQDASDAALPASARFIQMNDVSILLPLAKSVTERDSSMLNAGTLGSDGPLIDRALYEAATGEQAGPLAQVGCSGCTPMLYDNLRVVAVRIDPCFAHTESFHGDDTCRNQLRLVFQALVPNSDADAGTVDAGPSDSFTVVDGGVHAFYSITRSEVIDIANAIVNLRIASGRADDLGPLAPHPIAMSEGLDGAFVRGLYGIIKAHASSNRLVRLARMQSVPNMWLLSQHEIASGVLTRTHIKMLPESDDLLSIFMSGSLADTYMGVIGPPMTQTPDTYDAIMNSQYAVNKTAAERQAAFDATLRIENPHNHTPDTIDCASCHAAGVTRLNVGPKYGLEAKGNPNAFALTSPFVPEADMARTTAPDPMQTPVVTISTQTNIHMFSYIENHPSITPRVINETAVIVDYLNSIPH